MADYGKGDTGWFIHDRFGMFIHFGLYSLAARHEWVRNMEHITQDNYQKYFDMFNPDLFKPAEWARAAKEAGMKYFVITTKHHEGFCLWDTKYTDYKVTNTAFGRDLLREVVDAFRAEGLKVGLYYSLLDWHHPDFTVDPLHPQWNLPEAEIEKMNAGRDMARYRQYMLNQITELLTNYGKIDIMWFDFSYNDPDKHGKGKGHEAWGSEDIVRLIRKLAPWVIIDNRLDLPGTGDIYTPEQYTPDEQPRDADGNPLVWEGCHTFSGSWGYFRDENTWKTVHQCIEMLVNHVSRNGNLLMNVGPTSRGYLDYRALDRLAGYAEWMKYNSRAIYGCCAAPAEFPAPPDCRYTYNPETKRLYLHIFSWPFKHLQLDNLAGRVKYAQFLHDGSEVLFRDGSDTNVNTVLNSTPRHNALIFELPVIQPHSELPVIEIILK